MLRFRFSQVSLPTTRGSREREVSVQHWADFAVLGRTAIGAAKREAHRLEMVSVCERRGRSGFAAGWLDVVHRVNDVNERRSRESMVVVLGVRQTWVGIKERVTFSSQLLPGLQKHDCPNMFSQQRVSANTKPKQIQIQTQKLTKTRPSHHHTQASDKQEVHKAVVTLQRRPAGAPYSVFGWLAPRPVPRASARGVAFNFVCIQGL